MTHILYSKMFWNVGNPLSGILECYERLAEPLRVASGPHKSYKLSIAFS